MHSSGISIWFFVGLLLVIYGALIFGYGIWELATGHLAPVALAQLHAPVWWGGLQLIAGAFYCFKFAPSKK
jgi:hypothetical protein